MTVDFAPHPLLRIQVDQTPGTATLRLSGDLDLSCAELLEHVASDDLGDVREVVVDLHDLEFLDLAGLRALLSMCAVQSTEGRTVSLVRAQRQTRRLFALVGQHHWLSE